MPTLVRVIRRKPRGRLGILRDCMPGAVLHEVPVGLVFPSEKVVLSQTPEFLPRIRLILTTKYPSGGIFVGWEGTAKRQSTPPGNRGSEAEKVREGEVPADGR